MAGNTYYVSGTGNDKNNGLKEGTAFRTLQTAGNLVQAGDTVYVMNGTYDQTKYLTSPVLSITKKNGTASAPITFKAYSGHNPLIKSSNWQAIKITGSSYITIDGLTMVGNNDNITLKYAQDNKKNLNNPATSGSGVAIDGFAHHITVSNNTISKFGAAAISSIKSDYITVENNTVFENSLYSPYGNSAIGSLYSWNSDNNTTDYKMIFRGNVIHDNQSLIPWSVIKDGKITEGHGIIIDDMRNTQGASLKVAYKGKTLIANNVAYKNGGAGIQVYSSDNVDVVNNTTYQNANHPDELSNGEIFLNSTTNVRVINNIIHAKLNGESLVGYDTKLIVADKNLIYNTSKWKIKGTNTITGKDPLFVDAAKGNFTLLTGSPAIDAGSSAFDGISKNLPLDGDGNGSAIIDIGAYEAPRIVITAPEIQVLNGTLDIVDGSTTAINFGDTIVGDTLTKIFTIKNTGTGALNLSNLQLPDGFSLVGTLPTSVAAKASTTISVALNTTTSGTYSGSLSLNNNDSNESPFDFAISGTVKPAPAAEIQVLNNTVDIVDGSTTAINFGDTIVGDTLTKTFTIKNTGTDALNLSNLQLPDGFSLVGTLPTSVAVDASTTISVALNTTTSGTYSGSLSLNNNDSNESPFDFAISGTVKPAPVPEFQVLNGTEGSDYLNGNAPANKIYGFGGNDIIVGDVGNDQLWGGAGQDSLWGVGGNDLLYGDGGNDQLFGDGGNDTVFGGLGDDLVNGGGNNDWLDGGQGKDVLTGGYGADTFVLASGQGTDSISDFVVGTDKLALSGGLKFGQLLIQQQGSQTSIVDSSDNQVLVKLDNITSTALLAQSFITV